MTGFKDLNKRLLNVLEKYGFIAPTIPQEKVMPLILSGNNVLLVAPTGSGKTEAAILPIFSIILDKYNGSKGTGILAVYITPLRALNRDILRRLISIGKELGISVEVRHGDTPQRVRRKQADYPPQILITTPETLQAILPGKKMKEHLRTVKWVIIDEIHELVDDKRGVQLSVALERLNEVTNEEFQRIGLSATVGDVENVAKFLVGADRTVDVVKISAGKQLELVIESPNPSEDDLEKCGDLHSTPEFTSVVRRISELIKTHRSVLIFVNTRETAEVLALRMVLYNPDFKFGIHHSSLSKEVRIDVENSFKKEDLKAIICTSSLELGIDIGSVDLVVQFMSPRQSSKLVQRVGRAGHRIWEKSSGVLIAMDPDDILESISVCNRALNEQLEEVNIHENALDVLCNQIAGILLDCGNVSAEYVYRVICRSWAFRNLDFSVFERVVDYMETQGILWKRGKLLSKKRATFEYYYSNLSMIPDTKQYEIIDISSGKSVGVLDEEFVVNHDSGTVFIAKGQPWKIIGIEEDKVKVEEVDDPTGAIPSWEGELLPVPYDVAQIVGRIRFELADAIKSHGDPYKVLEKYTSGMGSKAGSSLILEKSAADKIVETIREQVEQGFPVPDNKTLVVEAFRDFIVIHLCAGTKVNETIAQMLSALLAAKFGSSVGVKADPYRIILQVPFDLSMEEVIETLKELKPDTIKSLLEIVLKQTPLFRWKFTHICKKMGAIEKDAELRRSDVDRLIRFSNDILVEETLRELYLEKLDVRRTMQVINKILNGEIAIKLVGSGRNCPSPIASTGLKWFALRDLVSSNKPEREIINAVKKRLLSKKVKLACVFCGNWEGVRSVNSLPEKPKCPLCNSGLLAVLSPREESIKRIVRKFKRGVKLDANERKRLNKAMDTANLVLSMGKKAIIVLAGRGVGATTAKRILARINLDYDEVMLFKSILDAEKQYARTRAFWDD
ncbi:MAG: DEAD/DEAH box helicase [Candidatus Odinarchaeia archaeon]